MRPGDTPQISFFLSSSLKSSLGLPTKSCREGSDDRRRCRMGKDSEENAVLSIHSLFRRVQNCKPWASCAMPLAPRSFPLTESTFKLGRLGSKSERVKALLEVRPLSVSYIFCRCLHWLRPSESFSKPSSPILLDDNLTTFSVLALLARIPLTADMCCDERLLPWISNDLMDLQRWRPGRSWARPASCM